jgi:TPR repeat protein
MYARGEGVEPNDSAAFRLFLDAARQGYTGAQIKLGYMYAAGRGTRADSEKAYEWVLRAALAGDERGRDLLASIRSKLTPNDIAKATERARASEPSSTRLTQGFLP